MSWVTGDTNDNKIKKEQHNDNTLERLIQARQHMRCKLQRRNQPPDMKGKGDESICRKPPNLYTVAD
jgi:hypothetical protein